MAEDAPRLPPVPPPPPAPRARDVWAHLGALTPARIALGRAGASLPTRALLDFQLAHAQARDAVHAPFDSEALRGEIEAIGARVIVVQSMAADRATYLLRPDLGRRLDSPSRERLQGLREQCGCDLALIVSDGLSARAAHRQAVPMLAALWPALLSGGWRTAPIAVAASARVALEDDVGEIFGARIAVMLIGERPGLGAPDSLGAYLVYGPRAGRTDAERNCISNIRPEGLAPEQAARKLLYLLNLSLRHGLSGVQLKDESHLLDGAQAPP